jgi:O-antigen ligase
VTRIAGTHRAAERKGPREVRIRLFGALVLAAVGPDLSTYVAGVFHLYVHDLVAALVAIYGIALARENRSTLPAARLLLIPIGLLVFLLANTIVVGAAFYANIPPEMEKLFWFEHGDALRIVGELVAWVWALGQLAPDKDESTVILDFALWGCALYVGLVGAYWATTNTPHVGTTAFDLDVMIGVPLAAVFVMTRGHRLDLFRLVWFSAASVSLYSRTAIVAVMFTTVAILVTSRRPRAVALSLACLCIGWILAFGVPKATSAVSEGLGMPQISNQHPTTPTVIDRTASLVSPELAPYTIPSRLAIWADALRIAAISPIVGVGYHNYFAHSRVTEIKDLTTGDLPGLYSSLIKQAHNDYLSWLAETGIIGLTAYLSFLSVLIWHASHLWLDSAGARSWSTFALALIISLAAVSTFGEILIPRTPEWVSSAIIWWIVIGLVFVHATKREEPSRRADP